MDCVNTPVEMCATPVQSRDNSMNPRDTPVNSRSAHAKSHIPPVLTSDTQASAIAISAPSGAPLALPHPKKSRRRRRRRNRRSANENSAPRSAVPVAPDERWANSNSASQRATQPQPAASDPTLMMSTLVYQPQSFHSSHLPQPPISTANENSLFQFGLEHGGIPGVYKPALPDLSQDLNTIPDLSRKRGWGSS